MKIFLDTNVLIDAFLNREGFNNKANEIIENNSLEISISALSIPNLIYICKVKELDEVRNFIRIFSIINLTEEIISKSFELNILNDFEDSIQIASFLGNCDYFVTRDKKLINQFKGLINILTPKEFLELSK